MRSLPTNDLSWSQDDTEVETHIFYTLKPWFGSDVSTRRPATPEFYNEASCRRTSITVSALIVPKGLWIKLRTHATLLQTIHWHSVLPQQGPNQIDLCLAHCLHSRLIRKASIRHHLLKSIPYDGHDSLSVAPYLSKISSLLDIGSGAGFPGIPLKIIQPSLEVTLIDSVRKKVDFQRHIIRTLGLK